MPELAQHYMIIAPDLRGLGDTAAPACCYTKKAVADDLYRLVHALRYTQIDLVSHDIGEMVAYAYAAAHQNEVHRLVLMDAPIPSALFYQFPTLTSAGPSSAWHFGFNSVPSIPEELVAGREREYLSYFYQHLSATPSAISEDEINEYLRHYKVPASLHAGFEYYRAFPQDVKDNAIYSQKKLTMPILALGGDHSGGTQIPFEQMKGLATNEQGGAVPNCGHWIPEEQPRVLTQRLLQFLP